MAVTPPDLKLAERLCGPELRPIAVSLLQHVEGGVLAVLRIAKGKHTVHLVDTKADQLDLDATRIFAFGDDSNPPADDFFAGDQSCFLVVVKDALHRFDVSSRQLYKLVDLPAHDEVDAIWLPDEGGLVCCTLHKEERDPTKPLVLPRIPAVTTIQVYRPRVGWRVVSYKIPDTAERLVLSRCGRRCAFANMKNIIPEEAERGEWHIVDLVNTAGCDGWQVTVNAGRVGEATFSPEGNVFAYTASYSTTRPITTHLQLWAVMLPADVSQPPNDASRTAITQPGEHVQCFNYINDTTLAITLLEGPFEQSYLVDTATAVRTSLSASVCGPNSARDGTFWYAAESQEAFVWLQSCDVATGGTKFKVSLPHDATLAGFEVEVVEHASHDGLKISGFLCQRKGLPKDAPLLVHAHGGPAVGFACRKAVAGDCTRYPYRQLLAAGYRVYMPLFRGTLGFGDDFAQANIKKQGRMDSDLGDIMTGIEALRKRYDFGQRVGIFGGSYGGYMTMRAMAVNPEAFMAGVAQYGFVHGRVMSLEGGDMTWEQEYVGELTWPLTPETTDSDVFERLGNITRPMLLLHGEKDDICPVSQSYIAYRDLQRRGVPTGCIIYPGEGHGFDQPEHQQHRDRTLLDWFSKHIPVSEA